MRVRLGKRVPHSRLDAARRIGVSVGAAVLALFMVAPYALADTGIPLITVFPADEMNGMVCSPSTSSILPAVVNTITIRSESGEPMPDLQVRVLLTARNPACPDADLTGVTDANGICTITIAAGGCSHLIPASAVIKAAGVTIRAYPNIKGPDFDGAVGNRDVDLSDLVAFADQFNGVEAAACHDYDNDEDTDIADLVLFGAAFSGGLACP